MNLAKVLEYWLDENPDTWYNITYVDGVKVDIATLTELPDVLIIVVDPCTSYTIVKTIDTCNMNSYCIHCSNPNKYCTLVEILVYGDEYDYVAIPWRGAISSHLRKTYGDRFPSNIDVLYRLVRLIDPHMSQLIDGNELISRFEAVNLIKRANHD